MTRFIIILGSLYIFLTPSVSKSETRACLSLFDHSSPSAALSSIGHSFAQTIITQDENIVVSVTPYLIDQDNLKVTSPRSSRWIKTLQTLCKFCSREHKDRLTATSSVQSQRVSIEGKIDRGTIREIQMKTGAFSVRHRLRDVTLFSGVQVSLDFNGDDKQKSQTSLILHARKLKPGTQNEYESFSFKSKIPEPFESGNSIESKARSYVVDFDQFKLTQQPLRTFEDFSRELEIVGLGIEIEADSKTDLNVEMSIVGDVFFVKDLAKLTANYKTKLLNLSREELINEFYKEYPYFGGGDIAEVIELIRSKNPAAITKTPEEMESFGRYGGGYDLYVYLNENRYIFDSLTRQEIVSFFQDRPTMVLSPMSGLRKGGGYSPYYWSPKKHLLRDITQRLYDRDRQNRTIQVLEEQGLDTILRTLEKSGFHREVLGFSSTLTLWKKIAPPQGQGEGEGKGNFGIVTDIGDFGRDHGEISHLLQVYTIIQDMDERKLEDFKSIFSRMRIDKGVFHYYWTTFFEAPGSATANSPRYWRDLVERYRRSKASTR